MKVFLSYPSSSRSLADRLRLALEAEGHDVFFDRSDLRSGEYFHQTLREAIDQADVLVFLITPASVKRGSYCLTELSQAEQRWRRPGGRVLPVLVEPTPMADIPPYLQAVTLLQPQGEPVAETVAAVARLGKGDGRRWLWPAAAIGVALLGLGTWQWQAVRQASEVRQQAFEVDARVSLEAAGYASLCQQGSHATAWSGLSRLAETPGSAEVLRLTRQNCAMDWLRNARVISGQQTFTQLVAPLKAVLAEGLAKAEHAERLADLRAHLGWAEFLERREGGGVANPIASYQQALKDDPQNVYALAMWGHNLLFNGQDSKGGRELLDRAMAVPVSPPTARLTPEEALARRRYAQGLALSQALERDALPWALQIANAMRQQQSRLSPELTQRFWSTLYGRLYRPQLRAQWQSALPPAEALATFEWMHPPDKVADHQRDAWELAQSLLRIEAGQHEAARDTLLGLQRRLKAQKASGPLPDAVEAALRAPGLRG